ncbi:hypothetical protein Lacidipiscis_00278 [Ligilactobacillus acidipiscis]|nr:hypothetical protein Lacidipiscis_00278 [Ligilactobacillus acidipiscis]GEN19691.1 hypothetical protein LAC02_29720 [Ligilactobacillus acidipiscis]
MKLTVEGTTEEIKNVLQAIGSSEEHGVKINADKLAEIYWSLSTNRAERTK